VLNVGIADILQFDAGDVQPPKLTVADKVPAGTLSP
jgi:hypothetical protein